MQHLSSSDGLAQGDALSSCIFGVCVACMLAELQQLHPTMSAWAYMDDIVVDAPVEEYETLFADLQKALQRMGLSLNHGKCKAWWGANNPQTLPMPLWQHRATVVKDGLVICGLPTRAGADEEIAIGPDAFLEDWLRRKTQSLVGEMQLLGEFVSIGEAGGRPALQVAMNILKTVYPAKVMRLQRCYSQDQPAEMQEELQQASQRLLLAWLQEEHLTAQQWEVASLPPHMGGLGFPQWQKHGPIIRTSAHTLRSRACSGGGGAYNSMPSRATPPMGSTAGPGGGCQRTCH